MQLNVSNNINFQSRNQTIRFADDIVRKVKSNYPVISPSRIQCYPNFKQDSILNKKLDKQLDKMRAHSGKKSIFAFTYKQKILGIVNSIKKYNSANCSEFAFLSCITAKINGLTDCYPAIVKKQNGEDLDHAILYVKGKKPYIIDAWLGFSDYVSNAIIRYKNEFQYCFDNLQQDDKIKIVTGSNDYYDWVGNITSAKEINKLRKLFPELIIQNGQVLPAK